MLHFAKQIKIEMQMTVWNDIQVKWFLEASREDNKQLGGMTFYVVFWKAEIVGGADMLPSFSQALP